MPDEEFYFPHAEVRFFRLSFTILTESAQCRPQVAFKSRYEFNDVFYGIPFCRVVMSLFVDKVLIADIVVGRQG